MYNTLRSKLAAVFLVFSLLVIHNQAGALTYADAMDFVRELAQNLRDAHPNNSQISDLAESIIIYGDAYKVQANAAKMFGDEETEDEIAQGIIEAAERQILTAPVIVNAQQFIQQAREQLGIL